MSIGVSVSVARAIYRQMAARRCLLGLVLIVLGLSHCSPAPTLQGPDDYVADADRAPGEQVHFGLSPFRVSNREPIRLVSARMQEVSPGLEIVAIRAANRAENNGVDVGIEDDRHVKRFRLHSLRDAILTPGSTSKWQVILSLRALKPGRYEARGLLVVYEAGGRMYDKKFDVEVVLFVAG